MANIFENQTSNYDGSASPTVGVAPVRVAFHTAPANYSHLRVMARPAGSDDPFIAMKFPDGFAQSESDIFRVDVTGLEYYYQWTINEKVAGNTPVSATLTEF